MTRTRPDGNNGKSLGIGKQTSDRVRSIDQGGFEEALAEGRVCRVGVDFVPVNRMKDLLDRHGRALTRGFFTPGERRASRRDREPAVVLAAGWGLREAAFKVVGCGRLWSDFHVDFEPASPRLVVSDTLYQRSDVKLRPPRSWHSELERTRDGVIAVAAATWKDSPFDAGTSPSLDVRSPSEPPECQP